MAFKHVECPDKTPFFYEAGSASLFFATVFLIHSFCRMSSVS